MTRTILPAAIDLTRPLTKRVRNTNLAGAADGFYTTAEVLRNLQGVTEVDACRNRHNERSHRTFPSVKARAYAHASKKP